LNIIDQHFDGLAATQNPEWLDQSPALVLQGAARYVKNRTLGHPSV
jgi:hypothetical protein